MDKNQTIIITGSSGFIGSRLVGHFLKLGFNVRTFQRAKCDYNNPMASCFHFELSEVKDMGFQGADYLVHSAYQPVIGRNRAADVNLEGAKKIISLCRKYGVKMVFLSTLSAHSEAESNYGRQKLLMESLFDPRQDLILKPGLVLGEGGGLFGRIASVLKTKKIIPLVGGGKQRVQTIELDDLCRIIELGIKKNICGSFMVATPDAITLKELYLNIAKKAGSKPLFIPVPTILAYFILRFAEISGIRLPITSENVLGLKHLKVFNTAPDLRRFGAVLKNYK
ncbi:MAG: NAD-dependent epimerase/dehydratase family protein [Patescibacteria group bacterium]